MLNLVQVALSRSGLAPQMTNLVPWQSRLVRPGEEAVTITLSERPPLASVALEVAERKTA